MFEAFANWIVYDFAGLQGTPLGSALQFFVMDVSKILVLLTLAIYVMGLLRALLAPEKVREFIRRRSSVCRSIPTRSASSRSPRCCSVKVFRPAPCWPS